MDAQHLPREIGTCAYCRLPLYALAPVAKSQLPTLAHVACAVDAHRHGQASL